MYCFLFSPCCLSPSLTTTAAADAARRRTHALTHARTQAVGGWLRYLSVPLFPVGEASFELLLFGQFLVALVQPFFLNIVSKIAGDWFAQKEREIATVVAALAQVLGNALGQVWW
jgi:hypothetical protein